VDPADPGGGAAAEEGLKNLPVRVLAALVITAAMASIACAADPTDAEIDQGHQVYDDFCVTCHGRDMVNPGGVTFDLRKFPKDDFERFRNSVLNGKPPGMPPWPMSAAAADHAGLLVLIG
jgi:mono/diheme cytochrome c family protein